MKHPSGHPWTRYIQSYIDGREYAQSFWCQRELYFTKELPGVQQFAKNRQEDGRLVANVQKRSRWRGWLEATQICTKKRIRCPSFGTPYLKNGLRGRSSGTIICTNNLLKCLHWPTGTSKSFENRVFLINAILEIWVFLLVWNLSFY